MARYLLLGGNGFIGRNLRESYPEHHWINIDKFPSKQTELNDNYLPFDYGVPTRYDDLLKRVDGIIILAAVSRVITAQEQPERVWRTNVENLQEFLTHIQKRKYKAWIIYGSSREVYGEAKWFPVDESHPLVPINRYGHSKLCAELLLENYHRQTGNNTIILRFSNVYGGKYDFQDRVIPKFIKLAWENKSITVNGYTNTFDFTHIIDTINSLHLTMKALEYGKLGGFETFNICTGIETDLHSLAVLIINKTNSSSKIVESTRREYDVNHFRGSHQKATDMIGYFPTIKLENGISNYITQHFQLQEVEK